MRIVGTGETRAGALRVAGAALARAGIDTPALDARLLAEAALGIGRVAFVTEPDTVLDEAEAARLDALLRRRLAREPVARILGAAEFWGLPFRLSPDTLVPRPDTETLVEAALRRLPADRPLRVLDLGTGSGCILVALLHERPGAFGIGIDRAPGALATARANAHANGVGARAAFAASSWAEALGPVQFDAIVSNPPYIPDAVVPILDPEVAAHDPVAALAAGPDGLAAYRAILADGGRLLAPGGLVALEIGHDQGGSVPALANAAGFRTEVVERDLGGRDRVVVLRRA